MRNLKYHLLVFDWDGTLFNSAGNIVKAIQSAAQEVNLEPPTYDKASKVIGLGLQEAMRVLAPNVSQATIKKLAQAYLHHYNQHACDITLFEGVEDMLHDLKEKGHLLAIATGKSRNGLNEALHASGLHYLFDASRTADQTASKPNPLMLRELICELDCTNEQTLMIGDTSYDLGMAQNTPCASVGVTYGVHPAQELDKFSPKYIASTIEELQTWLLENS